MNNLRSYFTSPLKTLAVLASTSLQSPNSESNINIPIIKKTKTDGRKIIKNMEEVLNSVKKKHKKKHKRSHRRKKITNAEILKTPLKIIEISDILNNDHQYISKGKDDNLINALGCLVSPSKENFLNRGKGKKRQTKKLNYSDNINSKKTDLRLQKNSKVIVQNLETNAEFFTAVNEVQKIQHKIDEAIIIDSDVIVSQQQTKKNAFEFMMNARNKSFGSNSPGKIEMSVDNIENSNIQNLKTKRKLFLEEWADKKGAGKRKLDEDTRGEYIEYLLTKRAKRMKNLIANGSEDTKIISTKKQNKIANNSYIKMSSKVRQTTTERKIKHCASVESEEPDCNSITEDTEFVEKLQSPIKKRDSLLGYFPKSISPNKNEKVETKHKNQTSNLSKAETVKINESNLGVAASRPRRKCVGKARYDYDLDKSPTKLEKKKSQIESKAGKINKVKQNNAKDDDIDIICLNDSTSSIDNKSTKIKNDTIPKKLAPLFVKTMPKPNIDPKIQEARHAFLMSGVPEKMKQELSKQKIFEEIFEASTEIFPKICHVPQWENYEQYVHIKWENYGIIWFNEEPGKISVQNKKNKYTSKFKSITCPSKKRKTHLISLTSLPQLKNKIAVIKSWKNLYEKFPTYKCYNQLREKYRYFTAMDSNLYTQQITESFVVTTRNFRMQKIYNREDNDELPPAGAPNGELLFTEKYKPMTSDQILVNLTPVNALKEFLSSWQDDRRIQRLNDSMDDFDYNNDSNNSINSSNTSNVIVLLGPSSSGKTQAVFSLAGELNFNILEINAGMKRTGKKLLQELQEATQSHQISKDLKNNLIKKSMKGINSKKLDINFDNQSSSELSSNGNMSLILLEDADITFDQHDGGYIDAIHQLASISKRPVVIIANNRNCPYLLRLINLNSIEFSAPNALNISKFLTVLSLMENCPIDLDEIISLYLFNNMDLRKTILEIQFFIQSGGDRISSAISNKLTKNQNEKYYASPTKRKRRLSTESYLGKDECMLRDDQNDDNNTIYIHHTLFELFSCSQNFKTFIPYPVNLSLLWTNLNSIFQISKSLLVNNYISPKLKFSKISQIKNNKNNASSEIHILNTLVDFYENLSVGTCLSSKEINDRLTVNMEEEISHLLIEDSIHTILKTKQSSYNLFVDNKKKRINLTPNTTNSLLNSKAKFLDYEATLRSICRSEKTRSSLERRGTRFYHYLRNNCIKMDTFSTELFDDSCSILIQNNTTTVIPEIYENC